MFEFGVGRARFLSGFTTEVLRKRVPAPLLRDRKTGSAPAGPPKGDTGEACRESRQQLEPGLFSQGFSVTENKAVVLATTRRNETFLPSKLGGLQT